MQRFSSKAWAASAFLTFAAIMSAGAARAEGGVTVKLPGDVAFSDAGPGKPQVAVLYGDQTKPGLYIVRLKFPAGFKAEPHTHPEEVRTLTVLSGTLYFGFGEKFDESKVASYPPGTFFTELPTTPHFVWAKDGDVIVQVAGIGPSGFIPASPSTH